MFVKIKIDVDDTTDDERTFYIKMRISERIGEIGKYPHLWVQKMREKDEVKNTSSSFHLFSSFSLNLISSSFSICTLTSISHRFSWEYLTFKIFTSAPWLKSSSTMSGWSPPAAQCKGVCEEKEIKCHKACLRVLEEIVPAIHKSRVNWSKGTKQR